MISKFFLCSIITWREVDFDEGIAVKTLYAWNPVRINFVFSWWLNKNNVILCKLNMLLCIFKIYLGYGKCIILVGIKKCHAFNNVNQNWCSHRLEPGNTRSRYQQEWLLVRSFFLAHRYISFGCGFIEIFLSFFLFAVEWAFCFLLPD